MIDFAKLTSGVSQVRVATPGGNVEGLFTGIVRVVDTGGNASAYASVRVGQELWIVSQNQTFPQVEPGPVAVEAAEPPPHEVNISTGDSGAAVQEHPG